MTDTVIRVKGLTKKFGDFTAVDHIDFAVEQGSIFGLLGANGAGKTTAIRILCGLMDASEGSVILAGVDVRANPDSAKKRIGYMSQRFSLYRDLTVEENLEFFGGLYGSKATKTDVDRKNICEEVGLNSWEKSLAGDLPGGVAQRLALACAMSHNPEVLFLDEPTAGVDPVSRRRFWDLIHKAAAGGTTVVVTTHYLDEAEYCDKIVLMHAGRIAASGGPEELKRMTIPGTVLELSGEACAALDSILAEEAWVLETSLFGDSLHLQIDKETDDSTAMAAVRRIAADAGIPEPQIRSILPSLEDVFLRIIDNTGESR